VAWFSRFTRFGDMHLVYGQEANMSCGIASVMMCIFKINKIRPGRTALTLEKDICKKYEAVMGSAYSPETTGTYPEKLAAILSSFTSGTWKSDRTQPEGVPQKLTDKVGVIHGLGPVITVNPVILGVDWDLGGAHWIVVDTVRQMLGTTYATVCDPWDTNVHIQSFLAGSVFVYNAATGGFTVDMGGTNKGKTQPYKGNAAKGAVKTWGMIYRD